MKYSNSVNLFTSSRNFTSSTVLAPSRTPSPQCRLTVSKGPVVRTTPNELHFSSPEAWKAIYSTSVFVKDESLYKTFGRSKNSFTLISPPRHKERREQLATHFSRKSILELQGLIQDKVRFDTNPKKIPSLSGI